MKFIKTKKSHLTDKIHRMYLLLKVSNQLYCLSPSEKSLSVRNITRSLAKDFTGCPTFSWSLSSSLSQPIFLFQSKKDVTSSSVEEKPNEDDKVYCKD